MTDVSYLTPILFKCLIFSRTKFFGWGTLRREGAALCWTLEGVWVGGV